MKKSPETRPAVKTGAGGLVEIYTDGACSGNPGPGGWCAIMRSGAKEKVLSGGDRNTTNNRMEMLSALEGLKALKRPCKVRLVSDSKYLVTGMTEWVGPWMRRGWTKRDGNPVLNKDLWEALLAASRTHDVEWVWVQGHAGHEFNEKCDRIARDEIKALMKKGR